MELGIDLGTANTVVSDPRRGIVYDEPSVMLLYRRGSRRERVLAVGREAAELLGRAPSGYVAVRPLQDGVVTDLEVARLYLHSVLRKVGRRAWTARVRAVVGVAGRVDRAGTPRAPRGRRGGGHPPGDGAGRVDRRCRRLRHRPPGAARAHGRRRRRWDGRGGGVLLRRGAHAPVQQAGRRRDDRGGQPATCASSTRSTSASSGPRTSRSGLPSRTPARSSSRAATPPRDAPGWRRCRPRRWPRRFGRSPTRSSTRSPRAWTTFPRRALRTCWPRVCWCSAEARWSLASPTTSSDASACR